MLSKRYYKSTAQEGRYTRSRGLDRETNKQLLLKHLEHFPKSTTEQFREVLPSLTRGQLGSLMRSLKEEGKVRFVGVTKAGYWERTDAPNSIAS